VWRAANVLEELLPPSSGRRTKLQWQRDVLVLERREKVDE
jgi:hypothetical protein